MKFIKTAISDVYVLEPSVFRDDRGYFLESFNLQEFEENIGPLNSFKTMSLNLRKAF
jgi:dTDP-4-dehydrorhamnose 3,5-epimerase